MVLITNDTNEVTLLLESLLGSRMKIDSMHKKAISGNRTKYTIIVEDTSIPATKPNKPVKKPTKKETPKEKVVIQKEASSPEISANGPVKPAKPSMATITNMGSI